MTFKLEVGKTYVSRNGSKYLIVSDKMLDNDYCQTNFVGLNQTERGFQTFTGQGRCYISRENECDLVKEFREPVVHRRDIILMRRDSDGHLSWNLSTTGVVYSPLGWAGWTEVKRQTVEYTEE